MAFDRKDPVLTHMRNVQLISDAGVPPPTKWTALADILNNFHKSTGGPPMLDQLVRAMIGGTAEDLPKLRALAVAEALEPQAASRVNPRVRAGIFRQLKQVYADVVNENYATLADKYDALAGRFTAAADLANPELPGDEAAKLPDKPRRAWIDIADLALQLDNLVPALSAAAVEAGVAEAKGDGLLALCCAPSKDHHVRRVWEAWHHREGRAGRWAALHKLGVPIRACPLDEFKPYKPPLPLEFRDVNGVRHQVDPHDDGYQPLSPSGYAPTAAN